MDGERVTPGPRRATPRDAFWVARLGAAAVDRHVRAGDYERERAMWPQPSRVRRRLLTAIGTAAVFVNETWVLEEGVYRAVVGWRREGRWASLRVLPAAVVFAALLVGSWWALLALHPVAFALGLFVVAALLGPAVVGGLREWRYDKPLREAFNEIKRTAAGPVYRASDLAGHGLWTGLHLAKALVPLADERRATIVLRTEGEARRKLYQLVDFEEAARARLFWGECVLMVRRPKPVGVEGPTP